MSKNIDITPFDEKNQRHGYWEVYWSNGNLAFKSFFQNNKRVGYEEWFSYTGNSELEEKKYYI